MTIRILSVASEAVPLIKTGGLADVVGALPAAVAPHGCAMSVMIPGYPAVMASLGKAKLLHRYDDLLGHAARLVRASASGLDLIVLDAPSLFAREGGPYGDPVGKDWGDNGLRFAAFARAAADLASGGVKGCTFDVVHAHDWQAAMTLAYLRYAPAKDHRAKSVMTIHNMAFQGHYGAELFPALRLPQAAWSIDGVEYHGGVGFLKAGLEAADAITTVSPSYAAEIRQAEFGMGLEGLIVSRGDRVSGIVNGIDPAIWSPEQDTALPAPYSAKTLKARAANKRALEARFGLEPGDGPIFIVISRLTWQKGMDVLEQQIDHLVGIGGRLALLGSGDAALEQGFLAAMARHPGRVGVTIGYDEGLSHLMQGGGDAILIPSRFEPCGLTQLYGLAYGCVPVVARTGGLADTVIDANVAALASGCATGFQFAPVSDAGLSHVISRAVQLYAQSSQWSKLQRNGMKADFSWSSSGKAYADLYAQLTKAAT